MEVLFEKVKFTVEYAATVNNPYTPKKLLATVFQLVFQTSIYVDDFKELKQKITAAKIWTVFKVFLHMLIRNIRKWTSILQGIYSKRKHKDTSNKTG